MIKHNHEVINKTCKSCIDAEKLGITSTRLQLLSRQDLTTNDGIKILDYRPDNLCNLKCRMCDSKSSSLISKENLIKINEYYTDDIYDIDFSNVEEIKLVGGEPSISKKIHKLLDWLITKNYNRNISVTVTTNATNANKAWIFLLSQFKKCNVIISVDGTEEVYNYIRTNAKWKHIVKNLEIYESCDFDISYQVTGSMYNIPVVDKWIQWFDNKKSYIYPVEGKKFLELSSLPDHIREKNIEFILKVNNPLSSVIYEMLSQSTFDPTSHQNFVEYTKKLDTIRKTDISNVHPIFKEIMNYKI